MKMNEYLNTTHDTLTAASTTPTPGRDAYLSDLPAERAAEFFEVAGMLEHDAQTLRAGVELRSHLRLPTMEDGRRVLSRATPEERKRRGATFFDAIRSRQRLGQGMHDRGEAFTFADAEPTQSDGKGLARHLPVRVCAISVAHKTLAAGEVWDVSVRGEDWGVDDVEELYVIVNVGVLVMEPGASLIVRGNVFSLVCQRLVRNGPAPENVVPGPDNFDIGILPTPFSVDTGSGPLDGADGADGSDGRDGLDLDIRTGMLGPLVVDETAEAGPAGSAATAGGPGQDGTRGRTGGMCKLAELTLREVAGTRGVLTVFAQAGHGGRGGDGGPGGHGGRGGHGGSGGRSLRGPVPGGDGGDGGPGGDGGDGGRGGHGGISSNVYITVEPPDAHKVFAFAQPSQPGEGGASGVGGHGGEGGTPGLGSRTEEDGRRGLRGTDGTHGTPGRGGKARPAAALFLNGEPL